MSYTNFGYIIERKRDLHPKKVALIDHSKDRSYTYEELDAASNKVAHALLQIGMRKGDRLVAVVENSVEFFELLFACNKIGAILVPVNFRLSPEEIHFIVQDVSPKVLVFHSVFSPKIEAFRNRLNGTVFLVSISEEPKAGYVNYSDFVANHPDESPGIHADGADTNVILYTSGSTGKPKGVIQTHLNTFVKSVDLIVDLQPTYKDVLLTMAPIFHVGGLNILTMSMFHVGGSIVLQNRFDPEQALKIIEGRKITLLFAIPTMLKMMIAHDAWKSHNISSLRYVVAGGEPVSQKVKDAFAAKGVPVLSAYGLTETSSMSVFEREFDYSAKSSTCIGKPPTHLECRIVDEFGREVKTGEVGELLHRGPTVTPGYWNRPEETARVIRNGWLYTNDLVYRDEDGYYYFVGRKDEMIKTGGEKVYPSEVEEVIFAHPKVAEVVVLGRPDEKWGQSVLAVVAPKPGVSLTEKEIVDYCKTKLSGYKCPKQVIIVNQLPHTGSGKVDRKQIRDTYGQS